MAKEESTPEAQRETARQRPMIGQKAWSENRYPEGCRERLLTAPRLAQAVKVESYSLLHAVRSARVCHGLQAPGSTITF